MSTLSVNIGAETRDDMAGLGIALPEPFHGEDAKSWFNRFEICAVANEWNNAKKLLRVPTLLKGRAWAVFELLSHAETDTYAYLKTALLARLSPDTAEERLVAREELNCRKFVEGRESIEEMARCIERLLDKASPGLPANVRDSELQYHLINALPDKVSLQLKLLPQENYQQTISKAQELLLIYSRSSKAEQANQVLVSPDNDRLEKLEETLQHVTQQLATLSKPPAITQRKCFTCGRPGHLARECRRNRDIECFRCGAKGHLARNCWQQGNGRGSTSKHRAGDAPGGN